MSNVITAYFKGRTGVAEAVYQNDYGMIMAFDGIYLPAHFDCYFSVSGSEEAIPGIGADNRVAIPNAVLAVPGKVEIHIPMHTGENDSEVEYVVYFKVINRSRPVDDGTPVQMTAIEQALALLQNPIGNIEAIVEEALSFTGETFEEMQEDLTEWKGGVEEGLDTWKDGVEDGIDTFETQVMTMVGTPLVAGTVAGMTDNSKIYVYTGSETGYTAGNWYYWNGSAWTSGGTYNSTAFTTDTTLTASGAAADSKTVGDKVSALKEDIGHLDDIINNSQFTIIPLTYINGKGYSWNSYGENPLNALTSRSDRAVAIVDKLPLGSKIIFDNTICAINYYIIGKNDIHYFIYSPDVWDTSEEITLSVGNKIVYQNDFSVIIQFKNPNGSTITDADIANYKNSVTVKYNNEINDGDTVDLIIFAGQSNIAGRGITNTSHPETAPTVPFGTAYEFKAITDPTKLYPLDNTFGFAENKTGYIDDSTKKTGSLVPSFVNAYHSVVGNDSPIICVSASQGGTSISDWKTNKITDAIQRLSDCVTFLTAKNIRIRHKYVVWCQGETDGDNGTSESTYKTDFNTVMGSFKSAGIEKCLMIRIGNCNVSGAYSRYTNMIQWQTEIAQTDKFVVMISCDFAGMRTRGLMKDEFHYYQEGYNECGTYAGVNAGVYAVTGKEQTMYDTESNSLYYSHKN